MKLRVVCVSDTHGQHGKLVMPEGDVLVHAGDWSPGIGDLQDLAEFCGWIKQTPYRHKVVVAGNHDFPFQRHAVVARSMLEPVAHYLEDDEIVIEGLRFYGSPWQPYFGGWAFNLHRGDALRKIWKRVPADTDVLVTHGPPQHILDRVFRGTHEGCADLRKRVDKIRPKLHVFGHIHEAHGRLEQNGTIFVNAAICGVRDGLNLPTVVEIIR